MFEEQTSAWAMQGGAWLDLSGDQEKSAGTRFSAVERHQADGKRRRAPKREQRKDVREAVRQKGRIYSARSSGSEILGAKPGADPSFVPA